jgi:putative membrane protein
MDSVAMRKLIPLLFCCLPTAALAHDLSGASPLGWGAEPWVAVCLTLSLLWYVQGMLRLWPRASQSRLLLLRQFGCFGAGWAMLALALASPLDGAGSYAFAAHMVQHEVLMIVAAPLLVLGRPLGVWVWALPARWRGGVGGVTHARPLAWCWRAITRPTGAWLLHFAALWLWHAPALFQAGLVDNTVHALQHASFLFTALLFWWTVLGRQGGQSGQPARGGAILSLFTTMMHTGALGALFTFSEKVWYPLYGNRPELFGLSPLEDQQLGGLIMWIPGGLAYVIAGLALGARWLAPKANMRQPALAGEQR